MYLVRKYSAIIMAQLMAVMAMYFGIVFLGLLWGVGLMVVGMLIGLPLAALLLRTPFNGMLEGKGLLALNMDSTGIIQAFIMRLDSPFIRGRVKNKDVTDVWDRETTFTLQAPVEAPPAKFDDKTGKLTLSLDSSQLSQARFGFQQYPVFIYNQQINSLLTKDFFAEKEKQLFTDHQILYLNRKVEELTTYTLHFARGVVELLKPKRVLGSPTFWVAVIVFAVLVILGIMFAPSIIEAAGGAASGATDAVGNVGGAISTAGLNP